MPDGEKSTADELDALARRVEVIDHGVQRDPERFHAEKSDIVAALRKLARRERGLRRRVPSTSWRAPASHRDV